MDKKRRILNYWYNMELFAPFWPKETQDTFYMFRENINMPWTETEETNSIYDVYLGKIKSQDLFDCMIFSSDKKEEVIEDNSQSCVCALRLDSDGVYVCNSFSISAFVWAIAKITAEKNLNTNLNIEAVDKINSRMDDILISFRHKIEQKDLEEIYSAVVDEIQLKYLISHFYAIINKKLIINKDDVINMDRGIFSGFCLSDIDMIRKKIQNGDSIVKYIEAMRGQTVNRIEIDNDVSHMKKLVLPERYPLGKWPSSFRPNLMQQIAINMGISEEESIRTFFSVNAPPGTGKTTLLKEIAASYVVERSILLCTFQNPDDAFTKCRFHHSANEKTKYYYQPSSILKKYGILVVSDNNATVENISKELSKAKSINGSNTKLFEMDKKNEIYFSDIAQNLNGNGEEYWGLISAVLDNKLNMNELKQVHWFRKDDVDLQRTNKQKVPDWKQAKEVFYRKHQEVLQYRLQIQDAVRYAVEHNLIMQGYESAKEQLNIITKEKIDQQKLLEEIIKEKDEIQIQMEILEKSAELQNARLGLWKRLFSFLLKHDPLIQELKQMKLKLDDIVIHYSKLNAKLSALRLLIDQTEIDYEKAHRCFEENEIMFQSSCEQIKKYRGQFGENYAGEEFWLEIQKNEESQNACPWTNVEYDTLREELFYYGLVLHKAFILNSKSVIQNLNCLAGMWNGNFFEADMVSGFTHLINTLFLVIPVISTTLDSVSTFLKYVEKHGIGTLIIHDADQLKPYSALGAIWRTCKVIAVGDPFGAVPRVTMPKGLSKRFADDYEIEPSYRSHDNSVQSFVDSINSYGGYRKDAYGKIWIGCPLVIHRRCLNPMFLISNQISYNGRLFIKSMEPAENVPILLNKSIWINIKGKEKGERDHFVPEQGVKAIEMIIHAFEIQNGFPSLYIISPFVSIATNVIEILRKELYVHFPDYDPILLHEWIDISCGTANAFQGKEANEVIFILGCEEKSSADAVRWAEKKPNLLNAVMTSAKYRIAVIGDSSVWGKVLGFDIVYQALSKG